jgi:hypothetical protein
MHSADSVTAALQPLPAGYHELYGRLRAAAGADARIRAMWLSGSLGRGVADAGSDLDLMLAVASADFDDFAATWRDWLAAVTPTVLARDLPGLPGSWYSVTPECLRLDVVIERAGSASPAALARRLLVLDKDDAYRAAAAGTGKHDGYAARAGTGEAPGPDPARLAGLTDEYFRQLAIFPAAVVARADWLLGVQAVHSLQLLLYELFVESNLPLPPMGVKQWSAKLTAGQRTVCAGLPVPAADRDSVLTAMRAATDAFRLASRQILEPAGAAWPAGFELAVDRYLAAELGWAG